jgi:hypothetical protein
VSPLNQAGQPTPFPNVPGVLKLSMKFQTAQDLDIVCNTHWKYSSAQPAAAADLNTFLTNVATAYTNDLQPLAGATVTHVQDTVTDLSANGLQAIQTHTQVGTRAGAQLPISACVIWNLKILRRYRGGKPRVYWPFGTETDLADPAHWSTAAQTAFNAGLGNFASYLVSTAAGGMVVQSNCNVSFFQKFFSVKNPVTGRYRNVATLGPTPPYPIVDLTQSASVNLTLGTQRRRLRPG